MVLIRTMASELKRRKISDVRMNRRKRTRLSRRTLKLGSASHEMRLAPQRHFASVYTIIGLVTKAMIAKF
jgi:hypothetical protein